MPMNTVPKLRLVGDSLARVVDGAICELLSLLSGEAGPPVSRSISSFFEGKLLRLTISRK